LSNGNNEQANNQSAVSNGSDGKGKGGAGTESTKTTAGGVTNGPSTTIIDETSKLTKAVELSYDKGTNTWTTPAGLDYGPGSVHGNRVKHVLDHGVANVTKPTHSVFNVDRSQILGLVDEAWITKGSPLPSDPGAYIVPMGRVVGTAGEKSIKVIIRPGTNKIITAYPVP